MQQLEDVIERAEKLTSRRPSIWIIICSLIIILPMATITQKSDNSEQILELKPFVDQPFFGYIILFIICGYVIGVEKLYRSALKGNKKAINICLKLESANSYVWAIILLPFILLILIIAANKAIEKKEEIKWEKEIEKFINNNK